VLDLARGEIGDMTSGGAARAIACHGRGVLTGKSATCFSSSRERFLNQISYDIIEVERGLG
jgi:hypothetical protein